MKKILIFIFVICIFIVFNICQINAYPDKYKEKIDKVISEDLNPNKWNTESFSMTD